MFKRKYHHNASSEDCNKLCCTKIENFSAHAGDTEIFTDVNMHIHCGQLTALIGPNGAGKSTLLKVVAGVFKPTEGRVIRNGKIVPLLELGAGFDKNYTGRENIFLYGGCKVQHCELLDYC